MPGPIGIDGVPGLPGQKGEKVTVLLMKKLTNLLKIHEYRLSN